MTPVSLKRRFSIHFVIIAEVLGYILSLAIIGGAIVMNFISVPVTINASGELLVESTTVTLTREGVVVQLVHNSGEAVASGAELLRVVQDPTRFMPALAYRALHTVTDQLKDTSDSMTNKLLPALRLFQAEMERDADFIPLTAPVAGVWICTDTLALNHPLAAGLPLGRIYVLEHLTMLLQLPAKDGARIKPGMPVSTQFATHLALNGVVSALHPAGRTVTLLVTLTPPPETGRAQLREALVNGVVLNNQSATITIGTQSLFSRLVLRK